MKKIGFIVLSDTFIQEQGTEKFNMKVVGIQAPDEVIEAAKKMVEEGIQIIELCGTFGPIWASRVIETTESKVPVGAVAYGPESMASLLDVVS